MQPDSLKLVRYRYGKSATSIEMQDRLQAASVTKDISGKEDIHLAMLGSFEEPQAAFTPGDFIALQDQTGSTWSWGRVSVVRSTVKRDPGGTLSQAPYTVMVQGWYDFLARSKVHVMSTSSRSSVGTLFNFPDWSALVAELANMHSTPAGQVLQHMLRKLLRIKLPPSLGGGWFHDEIPVVYDRASALRYAPELADIEPVEFGTLMPQLSIKNLPVRSADIGSLLANMFMFESSLVELIPYMATYRGDVPVPSTNPPSPAPTQAEIDAYEQAVKDALANGTPPPTDPRVTAPDMRVMPGWTKLGNILGAQPVLVYRIKPFRPEPLYRSIVSRIAYRPEDVEQGYLDRELALYDAKTKAQLLNVRAQCRADTTKMLFNDALFRKVTFTPDAITPLPYDNIVSMSRQRSDADRMNASTINAVPTAEPNGTLLTDVDFVGLPVAIENQIENHGLRLRFARWNMYPDETQMSDVKVYLYYRAVAAQVMQFYEKAHLYETGTMQLHFTHTMRAKEDLTLQMSTYDKAVLSLEPGNWFRTSVAGTEGLSSRTLTPSAGVPEVATPSPEQQQYGPVSANYSNEYFGYINSVTHNVQRLPSGILSGSTQLSFSRGHFADMWDVLHGVNVPLTEIDKPLNGAGGAGGQTAGGGRACALRPGEVAGVLNKVVCDTYALFKTSLDTFGAGEFRVDWGKEVPAIMATGGIAPYTTSNIQAPALANPADYNAITQKYITDKMQGDSRWLYCWFLEAISVMPLGEYQDLSNVLLNSTNATQRANLWALAACAYVIETYWRQKSEYDGVRLRIRSIPRAKDQGYHTLYAAMDFYLEYPVNFAGEQAGALQVWASLFKLAQAGRIPYGGRGLYLNVNPTAGIKGTAFSEAGSPSKMNCQYPPGGSSWTHYDIRAMWGITTRTNAGGGSRPSFFTSWVGTDWNGDGADEITLSNSFMPPKLRTQNGGVSDTADYTWANVADPDFKLLENYISGNDPRATDAPGVSAIMRARKAQPNYNVTENERAPVRNALRAYFDSNGTSDKWLHDVTSKVPNMFQVFEMNNIAGGLRPPPILIPPTKKNLKGALWLATDANGVVVNAPSIFIFGGTRVYGNSAGTYMYTYASMLIGLNHVVIAEDDSVTYGDLDPYMQEAFLNSQGQPSTLYLFSNGTKPTAQAIRAWGNVSPNPYYDAIYMVDAYLGSNSARAKAITESFILAMRFAPDLYRFFYTPVYDAVGNGMTQDTRNSIFGGGSSQGIPTMFKEEVPKLLTTTPLEYHMSANEHAMRHLMATHLVRSR